jgi:predicted AAA+ superfamily ATPase
LITRTLESTLSGKIGDKKAIILLGARQVGKSTLLHKILSSLPDTLWLQGDEPGVQAQFREANIRDLQNICGKSRYCIIDEAQVIEDIGRSIKLMVDNIPGVQVIATGSSAFELANKINEPLTGRKWEYHLFPLSFEEMVTHHGLVEERKSLHSRLLYGYYPEVVINQGKEKEILRSITDSFLYKDILLWEGIRKPDKLLKLLQALAFQTGNQVSYNELSQLTGLDNKTVEKYILLLEQTFVIFRLQTYSRNLRNELKNSRKIYFYDNGIRNALISAFQPVTLRQDIGALWENWCIAERQKYVHYRQLWNNKFFWRTSTQQEIDYIEESDGNIHCYEFKWNASKQQRFPRSFTEKYHPATMTTITPGNYESFIGNESMTNE